MLCMIRIKHRGSTPLGSTTHFMKKPAAILSVLLLAIFVAKSATVNLAWDGNCDTNIDKYILYYGPVNAILRTNIIPAHVNDCGVPVPTTTNIYWGNYTNTMTVQGRTNTSCTVSNLVEGFTYAFAVTAKDKFGWESDFSNEVTYTIPTTSPTNTVPTKVENFHVILVK